MTATGWVGNKRGAEHVFECTSQPQQTDPVSGTREIIEWFAWQSTQLRLECLSSFFFPLSGARQSSFTLSLRLHASSLLGRIERCLDILGERSVYKGVLVSELRLAQLSKITRGSCRLLRQPYSSPPSHCSVTGRWRPPVSTSVATPTMANRRVSNSPVTQRPLLVRSHLVYPADILAARRCPCDRPSDH